MTRGYLWSIVGGVLLCSTSTPCAAVTFEVDSTAPWLGFMNVFELPENGFGYVFGSGWGTADLVSNFSGSTLTLAPNSVDDPNAFWYTPAGGPGAMGNKWMDANLYVEQNDTLAGQSVTFTGTVLTNTFVSPYESIAFIRDFAPDYSTFETTTMVLTPGPFSVTLDTSAEPGRHVQYGFNTQGPNVWITDAGPLGTLTIETIAPEGLPGDYNDDSQVDAADYTTWRDNLGGDAAALNGNGTGAATVVAADYDLWKSSFVGGGSGSLGAAAVPEPGSCCLAIAASITLLMGYRRAT